MVPETGVESNTVRRWDALSKAEQLDLRESYGRYLDTLPRTCSMEEKTARFGRWLKDRGVLFGQAEFKKIVTKV